MYVVELILFGPKKKIGWILMEINFGFLVNFGIQNCAEMSDEIMSSNLFFGPNFMSKISINLIQ